MDLVFVLKWVKSVIGCMLYMFHLTGWLAAVVAAWLKGDLMITKGHPMNKAETTDFQFIIPPPISDAFDNREYFFLQYTNDSTLTLLRNSLFNINKQHIFSLL